MRIVLADLGVPVFLCRLDAEGKPEAAGQRERRVAGDASHRGY